MVSKLGDCAARPAVEYSAATDIRENQSSRDRRNCRPAGRGRKLPRGLRHGSPGAARSAAFRSRCVVRKSQSTRDRRDSVRGFDLLQIDFVARAPRHLQRIAAQPAAPAQRRPAESSFPDSIRRRCQIRRNRRRVPGGMRRFPAQSHAPAARKNACKDPVANGE